LVEKGSVIWEKKNAVLGKIGGLEKTAEGFRTLATAIPNAEVARIEDLDRTGENRHRINNNRYLFLYIDVAKGGFMSKILTILVIVACATMIGCQGTDVDQKQLEEIKSELEQIRAYMADLHAYQESTQAIQNKLFKATWRSNSREMTHMFKPPYPYKDTFPFPKPPPPPPPSIVETHVIEQ
jgi:hypothetical protein